MKKCSKCLIVKKLDDFPVHKWGRCGRHSICRICRKKQDKVRRQNLTPEQREKRKKYNTKWKQKFREHNRHYTKEYYYKNKDILLKNERKRKQARQRKWLKILNLPEHPVCEICGKALMYFVHGSTGRAVNFDHKNENLPIKRSPSNWLAMNTPTPEKIKMWNSCSFGILCVACNKSLPTRNRKRWVEQVHNYVMDGE